jgi:predicted RNA-binding Zn-ribbon protein involved in translation (DUF1610 family)
VPPLSPSYDAAWRDYRRRRTTFLGAGALLVLVVAFMLVGRYQVLSYWWALGILAPFTWYGVAYARFSSWPCPRCGQQFFVRSLSWTTFLSPTNIYAKRCVHCGLPKWASASLDAGGA